MASFVLTVLIVVLVIRWAVLRARLSKIEQRLEELSAGGDAALTEHIVQLTRRVFRLEQELGAARPDAPSAAPVRPVIAAPAEVSEAPEPVKPPTAPAGPTMGERLRALVGNEEWEALVGASLLNKVGALVLVIGIALFLAYSFTHMTPAGRSLTAFLTSAVLLGLGTRIERRQTYRIFSRGLIGAGWAGLYSTAYAMYAVPAARVIDNAFAGSLLLLAVAAGMIGHSLRYRAQAVTAVAYFAAFAALAVTPATPFAVVSLIPLAATLLYVAWRFRWHGMAVFGLVATYATCIARGDSDAPLVSTEALFVAYWLLFEAFDLLRIGRRDATRIARLIFPLNALGFLGLSYAAWSRRAPEDLWLMSATAAALYLAAALLRYRPGGYEAPLTLSAFLAGVAVVRKVTGVWMAGALAVEAELVYLAGIHLRSRFVRALGWAGFSVSLGRLLVIDAGQNQHFPLFGREIHNWTPGAVFHAALFYVNCYWQRPAAAFSWLAAGLVALVAGAETPERFMGAVWMAMAVALFELGMGKAQEEFRWQAYVLALMGVAATVITHLGKEWPHPWVPASIGLAIAYGYALRASRLAAGRVGAREGRLLAGAGAVATLVLGFLLLDRLVGADYLGLSWWLFSLALFELGLRRLPQTARVVAYAGAIIATLTIVVSQINAFTQFAPPPVWISYFGAGLAASAVAVRAVVASAAELPSAGERVLVRGISAAVGVLFILVGIWIVSPSWFTPVAWAAAALALSLLRVRAESYVAALAAFLHVWLVNLPSGEMMGVVSSRLVSAAAVAGVLYPAEFLAARGSRARAFFSALATLLIVGLLWYEVSGSVLTVAWGVLGLLLLAAGFPARERPLRLAGLGLLLFCILKLFIYDLRHLETLYRILAFVALGVILLGVSWIYTRFRDSIRRGLL